MRIAVLYKDKCQPKHCSKECIKSCPRVRTGDETIVMGEDGKPVISEELCVGCGICVHKCPFGAIKIIGLPEALKEDLIHQFGKNEFSLFRLPIPMKGVVTGILGKNGIGKTTVVNILSGTLVPNLGNYDGEASWAPVLEQYAGKELGDYLTEVSNGEIVTALKPQYVDQIPKRFDGKVFELLAGVTDDTDRLRRAAEDAGIMHILDREVDKISGGELQLVAITATMVKDADVYFLDEPSSYLDIYQRLKVSKLIKSLAEEKYVIVVEHDLAILDFMAERIHLMYGEEGAYGVVAQPRGGRTAINTYLDGYMREENIRFRDKPIEFEVRPPKKEWESKVLFSYPAIEKSFSTFNVEVEPGEVHEGEVVGVVGPNATGKTTFVKMLAGVLEPDKGEIDTSVTVSYKPQYIKGDFKGTVQELLYTTLEQDVLASPFYKNEVERPLDLESLLFGYVDELSGGELQRVAIALCLARKADIYLLDEPSAYLDSNQRMIAAKTIRRTMENGGTCALVVDHDIYFLDIISDSIMVFSGEGGRYGKAVGPFDMRKGMNLFLENVEITFRRDADTERPRINKEDSALDKEQKSRGEYYYMGV